LGQPQVRVRAVSELPEVGALAFAIPRVAFSHPLSSRIGGHLAHRGWLECPGTPDFSWGVLLAAQP
jgi:hypothetical protein